MIRVAALAALSLASPSVAEADEEILVTGRGLPTGAGISAYGTLLIDSAAIQQSASGRIEGALAQVAGFQQFRRSDSRSANPSAQGATLRALGGNAATRTMMLLDGVPVTDPFFGYIPFDALVPEQIGSVRVTRGGGSGAFAAGAVAGTIELESKSRDALPDLSAHAAYGSHKATELGAALTQDLGGGFVSVYGRWDQGDGFHTTPAEERVPATARAAYNSLTGGFRAVAPVGENAEIQARAMLFHDSRTLRFEGADSSSSGQDASVRLLVHGPWQVEALAYVQARNFTNIVVSSSSFRPTLDQRNTPATGLGGKLEVRPPVGPDGLLRLGVDTRLADGEMQEEAVSAAGAVTARRRAGGRQSNFGLFAEGDWTLGTISLTAGVRADRWRIMGGHYQSETGAGVTTIDQRFDDQADWQLSGRAGIIWKPAPLIALRAAAYSNFRLPTLNELYRPFTVFPVVTEANAGLKPEQLRGAEIGADLEPVDWLKLSVTLFDNRLEDAISNVTVGPNLRRRQNVDSIEAQGIELSASAKAGPFTLSGSLARTRSRVDAPETSLDGMRPSQSPALMANATLGWRHGETTELAASVRHIGQQYEDDLETDSLPAATTIDLFARQQILPGFSVVGRVENLLDEQVVTRDSGGSRDLGAPQTFWLGLRFER